MLLASVNGRLCDWSRVAALATCAERLCLVSALTQLLLVACEAARVVVVALVLSALAVSAALVAVASVVGWQMLQLCFSAERMQKSSQAQWRQEQEDVVWCSLARGRSSAAERMQTARQPRLSTTHTPAPSLHSGARPLEAKLARIAWSS